MRGEKQQQHFSTENAMKRLIMFEIKVIRDELFSVSRFNVRRMPDSVTVTVARQAGLGRFLLGQTGLCEVAWSWLEPV